MRNRFLALPLLLAFTAAQAQEFNCKVSVIAPQIQSTPKRVFQSMETSITQLMNTRRWTALNFSPQGTYRLQHAPHHQRAEFRGPLLGLAASDLLAARLRLRLPQPGGGHPGQQRPVHLPGEHADRFRPRALHQQPFVRRGLLYAYFLLGVDGDTYSPMGGSDFYAQAQTVVSNAQNASESGWKAFEDQKNRYWLVDNQQQGAFRPLRQFLYDYHRNGFDEMSTDAAKGRKACAAAIETLKSVHQAKPSSYNLQVLFNGKYNELVDLFKGSDPQERAKVYNTLQIIDPGHINQYMEMMKGSR
ncbi:MAG: DUF4835 family protein [Flavobacteriales bacterium]|nr:DUF4835 family protein [Flavobacteriales bacterium]